MSGRQRAVKKGHYGGSAGEVLAVACAEQPSAIPGLRLGNLRLRTVDETRTGAGHAVPPPMSWPDKSPLPPGQTAVSPLF
jgi:hypothetical protein